MPGLHSRLGGLTLKQERQGWGHVVGTFPFTVCFPAATVGHLILNNGRADSTHLNARNLFIYSNRQGVVTAQRFTTGLQNTPGHKS